MILIGICGLAGSGKDTASDFLTADGFVKIAFSDPMKRAVADWFQWDSTRLWGSSSNRNEPDPELGGLTARKALQTLGTAGLQIQPRVWINYALRTARMLLEAGGDLDYIPERGIVPSRAPFDMWGVVISDVRYFEEIKAIQRCGGKVVRLKRGSSLSGEAAAHPTEQKQSEISDEEFDVVIDNSEFTLLELRLAMHDLVKSL